MKKIKYLLFGIIFIPISVNAAGPASIDGPESIDNGGSATINVTVQNTAAWNIYISASGNTQDCSNKVADVTSDGNNTTKTFSLTCKSNGVGSITFTATGDITSSDGNKSYVNLTKSVTVNMPREKDGEARLKLLSIEGYDINFDKDKREYSIFIDPSVTSININASSLSKYAKVSGTGKKIIESDENKFIVTCTSEKGTKTEYKINVSIKDDNPIKIKINGKEYTVLKTNKLLTTPTNYEETTIKIGEYDIPAYKNEITKLTLVGLNDSDGSIYYAIYSDEKYSLYNENKSDSLLLYITKKELKNYKETTVIINDKEYIGYRINDRFFIVYAMNINTGKYNFYKYDKEENTFQIYDIQEDKKIEKKDNIFIFTTIIFSLTTCILIFYIVCDKYKNKKAK